MASFKFGFLIGVLTLCTTGIVAGLVTCLWLYSYLYNTINQCNTAVYQAVDFTVIRDQDLMKFTDAAKSMNFFRQSVQNAFSLDSQLKTTASSPPAVAGQVQIVSLQLKDEGNPMTLGTISINKNPAVRSVVKVPVKIPYFGVITSNVDVTTILPTSY